MIGPQRDRKHIPGGDIDVEARKIYFDERLRDNRWARKWGGIDGEGCGRNLDDSQDIDTGIWIRRNARGNFPDVDEQGQVNAFGSPRDCNFNSRQLTGES